MPQGSKVQKHTERLNIPGWDFVTLPRRKNKEERGNNKGRVIKTDSRFMDDVIAGRPVFGEPTNLVLSNSYGRSRASGLAAGINPVSMEAMQDSLQLGHR